MQREELRTNNGHDGRALERGSAPDGTPRGPLPSQAPFAIPRPVPRGPVGPRAGAVEPDGATGLGDVAKDALSHLKVIVSDSVAIGKLEVRRMATRAEEAGREIVPRVAVGLTASIVGLVGIVLGLVALFIGLGEVIPSAAVRLAIYAAAFLLIAAAGGFFALRPLKSPRAEVQPSEKFTARPTHEAADRPVDLSHISR
jgi:hypothetical protein